jgi:hypothetical protein
MTLSQGRYLHTDQHKQNKRTQKSMLGVGFEPMTPMFDWVKTVVALDRAATVIGPISICIIKPFQLKQRR